MPINPHAPTNHHPGSPGKLRVLRARARAGLPLFLKNDARGLRHLNDVQPSSVSRRSQLEVCLVAVLNGKEQPVKKLAALCGRAPCQRFRRALWLLRDAGVAERGKRGWRLVNLQL